MKYLLFSTIIFITNICAAQMNQTEVVSKATSVPCNPNTFWAIYESSTLGIYNIEEYTLINSVVTPTGNIWYNVPNGSLAYCNDLDGGAGNTFYNIDFGVSWSIIRFDGTNWINIPNNSGYYIRNCGGNANNLVVDGIGTSSYVKDILRYDGNNLLLIYNTGLDFHKTTEDIAIDINNQIWFFTEPDTTDCLPINLVAISNNGTLLHQFPLSINSRFDYYNAYGMFFLDSVLYVGLGPSNAVYPNELIPFKIINDSAVAGTPIPFGFHDFSDLESCNQGTLTSLKEAPNSYKQLSVYPNPATDQFSVYIPYGTNANAHIIVTNLQGSILEDRLVKDNKIPFNCEHWPAGMYLVSVVSNDRGIVTAKVLKQ